VNKIAIHLLRSETIRYYVCKIRYFLLKKKISFLKIDNTDIGDETITHNYDALKMQNAAFGMGGRMSLLILPTAVLLRHIRPRKVLIVGPRTEDDIFFAKSYNLDVTGLDLFTYSPYIELGDIHQTNYKNETFDAVLLGWMISYSKNPQQVIDESSRILKPNGLIGIGIESNKEQKKTGTIDLSGVRVNYLNTSDDLIEIMKEFEPVFIADQKTEEKSYDCAVIFKKKV